MNKRHLRNFSAILFVRQPRFLPKHAGFGLFPDPHIEQVQSSGNPPSVVPRLNNGYQTITWVHDGCASHTYASDTPSKPLLTTHVDSEWVVSGCTYPKMQLHVEKVVLKSQSWAAAVQI